MIGVQPAQLCIRQVLKLQHIGLNGDQGDIAELHEAIIGHDDLEQVLNPYAVADVYKRQAAGSISHSDNRAVAVVSRDYAGLGVDIEPLMTRAQAQDCLLYTSRCV